MAKDIIDVGSAILISGSGIFMVWNFIKYKLDRRFYNKYKTKLKD